MGSVNLGGQIKFGHFVWIDDDRLKDGPLTRSNTVNFFHVGHWEDEYFIDYAWL